MKHYSDQMPLYVAGQLNSAERSELEKHLVECPDCQIELDFWRNLADGIIASDTLVAAPVDLADRALTRIAGESPLGKKFFISSHIKLSFLRASSLLRAQAYLIKREMWPSSAAIMALGVIVALISNHVEIIYFIAPLMAAASLAMLYGPEHDPSYELTLATPTSPWKILLARLTMVSVYNLLLALAATLIMLLIVPPNLLGMIILGWLAPMAFLSALALLLSLWVGTNNAIAIAYTLWIAQYTPYKSVSGWMISPAWSSIIIAYKQFWQSPGLLFLATILLFSAALWVSNRPVFGQPQGVG